MYYLICIMYDKILQGLGTASGSVLQESCSRICGLSPRLIYCKEFLKTHF